MLEGLYAAGAGMQAAQTQLDAVANDMANENTPGYQATRVGFQDLLYNTDNAAPSTAIVGAGSSAQTIGFSEVQGSLQQTGNPLDVAIQGTGYLQVRQADGSIGLTRNGTLQLNARGQITTDTGMELVPPITLPKGTSISQVSISPDGTVSVIDPGTVGSQFLAQTGAGVKVGKIQIVQVTAPAGLLPQGQGVYAVSAASGAATAAKGSTLAQGFLEQSNVSLDTEIATMETAQQAYSMGSKAVQMEGQLGQIAATLK